MQTCMDLLTKHSHAFDITKSPGFLKCMKDFDLACLELKQNGNGYIKNYDEIEDEGKYTVFHKKYSYLWPFFKVFIKFIKGLPQIEPFSRCFSFMMSYGESLISL